MTQQRKPRVTIFATGGTIAGGSDSNTDTLYYSSGDIGIDSLLAAVPEVHDIASITGEQLLNVGSHEVRNCDLLTLAKKIHHQFVNDLADGVVITHGTDTLEETAFFLDITTQFDKPVVVVGAMRPATAMSADGPLNLLQATALAANPGARSRGTMIVLNDRIHAAFYTSKTHANALDTFQAVEQGSLGFFLNAKPYFYFSPAQASHKPSFDVSQLDQLPRVDILYSYQNAPADLLEFAIERGAKGVVINAAGSGWASPALEAAATDLTADGFPVVFASRTGSGFALKLSEQGIGAGLLNAQKSRILLMLALASGYKYTQIEQLFTRPLSLL
ncbi:MAG: L-asparaginase [Proteobacteria bacterium]|nr:MAG: L-asparaginase [Pseudomonadota bacterium]